MWNLVSPQLFSFQCFILDVGCGSGLSGECLSDAGHFWIGFDISQAMLSELDLLTFFGVVLWCWLHITFDAK